MQDDEEYRRGGTLVLEPEQRSAAMAGPQPMPTLQGFPGPVPPTGAATVPLNLDARPVQPTIDLGGPPPPSFGPPPVSAPAPRFGAPPPQLGQAPMAPLLANPPKAPGSTTADTVRPPQASTTVKVILPIAAGAIIGLTITVVAIAIVITKREASRAAASASASAAAATTTPAPTTSAKTAPPPPPVESGAPATSALALPTPVDKAAVAALEKLRDGVMKCASEKIHVLPGASPALPSSLAWVSKAPYRTSFKDYNFAFYSCTEFRLNEPLEFVIQWQVDQPGSKGTGVVWIDEDKDGTADRAYGVTIVLAAKDKPEAQPIEAIDKSRPVALVR
ncbi:MAG: hypothetical protein U0271_22385 [Polyangiaceae bacterium]